MEPHRPDNIAGAAAERAAREQAAYDEHGVWEASQAWHLRARHVPESPNSQRHEETFRRLLAEGAAGGRALDIGCGHGESSLKLHQAGASYVLGIDVAETFVAEATRRYGVPGKLEFAVADVLQPFEGTFDLIVGRSVLHHIDYQEFLTRAYRDNLAPGGRMVFMEPLGENLLTRAFHRIVRSAHTPDERPLRRGEIDWLRGTFPMVQVVPINYLSFPLGAVSTYVFPTADNPLMRWADRIDEALAKRPALRPRFRQAILAIYKPQESGSPTEGDAIASSSRS